MKSTATTKTSEATRVTVVVVPRERFSAAAKSLSHLLAVTREPFDLVYVDGGSPPTVALELRALVARAGGVLIRTEHFLTPNEARNFGVSHVRTPHLVFFDNDIIVTRGWLEALVDAAEETSADIVGPLICYGLPLHENVHCAGGDAHLLPSATEPGAQHLVDVMHGAFITRQDLLPSLARTRTEVFEFHCVLFRRDFFDRYGPLDEKLRATREHIDVCLMAHEQDVSIWFEPASVVTYLGARGLRPSDLPYYLLRWSNDWQRESLEYFVDKWGIERPALAKQLRKIASRRKEYLVRPLVRRITRGRGSRNLERAVMAVDLVANRALTAAHARWTKHGPGVSHTDPRS